MSTSIRFLGAAGTVTGSRHLLELRGHKLLVDCGLFQGKKENRMRNWEPFPVPPETIDRVLLTHAHIDHTGYLPRFCSSGFRGPVHCTHATFDLAQILLPDSAHLQEEDAEWANRKGFSKHKPALPLYTVADAQDALALFKPMHYGDDLYLDGDVRIKFRDAGHILGASVIDIKVGNSEASRKILFSGDIGRAGELILRDPAQVFNVDYLVLESTYGNRLHEDHDPFAQLEGVINRSVDRGGVLVIPAFAVGRTQMLLYVIRELEEAGRIPVLPVYVDSPMAIDTTGIFRQHLDELNLKVRIMKLRGKKVFQTRKLQFCKSRNKSKAINQEKGPAIIISASGMVTGGRILHHLVQRLPHRENTVMFAGYQAEGTRGRALVEGRDRIKIHGQHVRCRAHIESTSGFSGHADYEEILAWLMGFNRPPKRTFLVHGDPEASASLAEKIRTILGWEVTVPQLGEQHEIEV